MMLMPILRGTLALVSLPGIVATIDIQTLDKLPKLLTTGLASR